MTITKTSQLEPVLVFRDKDGRVVCGLFHDTQKQSREFYKWDVMDLDEIQALYNNGQMHDVANGRVRTPLTTNLEEVTVISKK